MGYKYPPLKTSRLADSVSQTAGGRPPGRPPTVNFSTVGGSRSTARSTAQKQRAELSGPVDRLVNRPNARPRRAQVVHVGRPPPGSVDRTVDRPRSRSTRRSTDVHSLCMSGPSIGPVDRPVDRNREPCSLFLGGRPSGRPSGRPASSNGRKIDRWRSTGRSTASCLADRISQTASFWRRIFIPHFFGILTKISRAKISPIYNCF